MAKSRKRRTATPLDKMDEKRALEQYRKIRLGSLRGAHTTQALIAFAKETLGPDWERKVNEMLEDQEDTERADEAHPH